MNPRSRTIGRKGGHDRCRPQIGAPNADIDHIGDGTSVIAAPFPRTNLIDKDLHAFQNLLYFGADVLSLYLQGWGILPRTQGHVKYGPMFRPVDEVACKHSLDGLWKIGLSGQIQKKIQGLDGNEIL